MKPRAAPKHKSVLSPTGRVDLSVVIPAFNEVRRLPNYLSEVQDYLKAQYRKGYEIIVVDDGSSDGTSQMVEKDFPKCKVVRLPRNRGKGAAWRAGVLAARGALILLADADGSTPIAEEKRLRKKLDESTSIVIGSRATAGGTVHFYSPFSHRVKKNRADTEVIWQVKLSRYWSGRIFSVITQTFTGLHFSDTQCGFKLIRRDAAQTLFQECKISRYAIDVELLYLASLHDFKVCEVPVNWEDIARSKVSLLVDSWRMLRDVIRMKRSHSKTIILHKSESKLRKAS